MRKPLIVVGIMIIFYLALTYIPKINHAQQETPAYAKWGTLAIKETQSKYPNAKIIDYLHVGSENQAETTIETFKLWLKDPDKEFGVYIKISYVSETEKVNNIEFQETSR
ncbi:DUF3889 domain-containing protein [Solibacillus sp. CAU 1738]|uniref:DUF3889 domain-containing protein n=1 Tax=Solibacillus sp. CAU 1738 TaxID=3140363 RepID=UPI0032601AD8